MSGTALAQDRAFLTLLGQTVAEEWDYPAEIEGVWPAGLDGCLYRNGPGRFERGGLRKRHALDGDGMVSRWHMAHGRVQWRNRFVQTDKLVAEAAAGHYRFPTWSTRAPGGVRANVGGARVRSQAGITIYPAAGRLLAWDEVGLPWAIDPTTLATLGEVPVAGPLADAIARGRLTVKAHARMDSETGQWMLLGVEYGRVMRLHVIVQDRDGQVLNHQAHAIPRQVYVHDFLATEHHVVVLLHPTMLMPLPFVFGTASFIDCLRWRPDEGMVIAVFPKAGNAAPLLLDAPAAYMWHGLNAWCQGNTIIADWVGYDHPDHFIGPNPALAAVLHGMRGMARSPGLMRRTIIDLAARSQRTEVLADGNFEFPSVPPDRWCRPHQYGFVTSSDAGDIFADGLARIDTESGAVRRFNFGVSVHVGEPVFAPGGDGGWLLAQCLDGPSQRTFLAVFHAERVEDGPVAKAWLRQPLPVSFHGCWCPTP